MRRFSVIVLLSLALALPISAAPSPLPSLHSGLPSPSPGGTDGDLFGAADTVWGIYDVGITDANVNRLAANGTTLFAGTWRKGGVYLSTDNGLSWKASNKGLTLLGMNEDYMVRDFAFIGSDVFVAASGCGLYFSSDHGANWARRNEWTTLSLAVIGTNLFVGISDEHIGGVHLSTDKGLSFTDRSTGIDNKVVRCLVADGATLYLGCAKSFNRDLGTIFTSSNNAASWKNISTGMTDKSVSTLAVSGNTLFAGTDDGIFLSTNNGTAWTASSNGIPAHSRIINKLFVGPKHLYAGTNHGVFMSADNGATWTSIGLFDYWIQDLCLAGRPLLAATTSGIFIYMQTDSLQDFGVWQKLTLKPTLGQFSSTRDDNIVTFDGHAANVLAAATESLIVRAPQALARNRPVLPDTTVRGVEIIATLAGSHVTTYRGYARFIPPKLLIHDQVTRADPPILQGVIQGPPWTQAFLYFGKKDDGMTAVRVVNTSLSTAPLTLRCKVIAPDDELFDKNEGPTPGNLVNIGNNNAGVQFPVAQDSVYIIVVEAADSVGHAPPWSFGPFPAQFQILLSGNVGLPLKLVNGRPEIPRGGRLDTYVNHPAPRWESLVNSGLVAGQWAETGLFKFANPLSVSRFATAVLIPPDTAGYRFGAPPVRAAPPPSPGLLPNAITDITVPMATTPSAADPSVREVIDCAQVPIPASVWYAGPPPGVARILGANDGVAVTLPYATAGGLSLHGLIVDMGSGNEIVDRNGVDFRVIALSGTYDVAVGNTPFTSDFRRMGTGTGSQDFDIAGTGLTTARYIKLSVGAGSASFDAVEALHLFADQLHPTAGPLADAGWATITMRRQKSPVTAIDPLLELVGPDGSSLAKNESGFGDDTEADRSDAALVRIPLTQQGFYRFLGRGYDSQPDNEAFGTYFTRLETAGEYDPVELAVSTNGEALTAAQKHGAITLPRQRDSYLFQSAPATTVHIVVNGVGPTALADPIVELYDPEDFLVAANDNYNGRGRNSVITTTCATDGQAFPNPSTYRIVVMGLDTTGTELTTASNSMYYARRANGGNYELKVFTGPLVGDETKTPAVAAATPNAAVQGATHVAVTIDGTDFVAGAAVAFSGAGVTVSSVQYGSPSHLIATVNVAANAPVGPRDVTVTNPGGRSGSAGGVFQVRRTLGSVLLGWSAPSPGQSMAPPGNLTATFTPSANTVLPASTDPGAGSFGRSTTLTLQSYNVYRSHQTNAKKTGGKIGTVGAGASSFSDAPPYAAHFFYQVTAVYSEGESAPSNEVSKAVTDVQSEKSRSTIPTDYALEQNYPNPFNPSTMIEYSIPLRQWARLTVYTVLGGEVAVLVNEVKQPGRYRVQWKASGAPSGMYFYQLRVGDFIHTRKMVVVR